MERKDLEMKLAERIKPNRYEHSIAVSKMAVELAKQFNVSPDKAYLAGLLHDCGRAFGTSELVGIARTRGICISKIEEATPLLLHAYIGADLLPEVYGINDSDVQQAIWRHTVGGLEMTTLDKIIYLADMIEPNRKYAGADDLRKLVSYGKLDDAMLLAFDQSISFVLARGRLIHPYTVDARNEILLRK